MLSTNAFLAWPIVRYAAVVRDLQDLGSELHVFPPAAAACGQSGHRLVFAAPCPLNLGALLFKDVKKPDFTAEYVSAIWHRIPMDAASIGANLWIIEPFGFG